MTYTRAMMIDLETLDTATSAVIFSIGYVIFDRDYPEYEEKAFGRAIASIESQQVFGRTISPATLRWWMSQSESARAEFQGTKTGLPLVELVTELGDRVKQFSVNEVWSKGANFDISILENVATQFNISQPWSYRQPRCFRTIQALFPDCREPAYPLHNALEDARDQAKELWRITQKYLLTKSSL